MFFIISKVVTFLLDPIFFILLFFLLCIIKRKIGFRLRFVLIGLFCCFYLFSINAVSNTALSYLETLKPPSELKKRYDAVIVLSGMVYLSTSTPDRIEFSGAVERIISGIDLVKNNHADYLIISGGDGSLVSAEKSEAELLKEFAIRWGVDQSRILVEGKSKNTYENAIESAKIIEEWGFKKLLLVTSASHMYRAYGCFTKAGVKTDTLSVDFNSIQKFTGDFRRFLPSSASLSSFSYLMHELIGIVVYGITGKARFT